MRIRLLSVFTALFVVPIVAVFAQAPAADTSDHQAMLVKLGITTPLRPGPAGRLDADGKAPANYANYDETKATAKSPVPQLLVMNDGKKITTAAQWEQRRKELFEIFDREFYGRLPAAAKTIKVSWEVTGTTQGTSGTIPTVTRTLVGRVDPTYYPGIIVNISASVTTPANAAGKVPVIIQFGGGGGAAPLPSIAQLRGYLTLTPQQATAIQPLLAKAQQDIATTPANAADVRSALLDQINAQLTDAQRPAFARLMPPPAAGRGGARGAAPGGARGAAGGARGAAPGANAAAAPARGVPAPPPGPNPPFPNGTTTWQQAAISLGWGYGSLNPGSIQADTGNNGALRQGIIGLINKGEPRKVDDWGALRAWAWGAGKLVDFFETDSMVDAKQVAFQGVSRYGKATLAAMVYEPRIANGFIASSGEGGAKIWRHLVGEQVESLAAPSEYHWMTPNFLKYAGPKTVDDLPADAHQFVALIAPRPVFVSGGDYVEWNDPNVPGSRWSSESWQDTPGTFMATAGASPVWKLLGKKPLQNTQLGLVFDDVPDVHAVKARMPPIRTPLIDGDIAFRQHDREHTDAPNWSTYIEFVGHYFKSPGFKR
jgi:hypothetical protein